MVVGIFFAPPLFFFFPFVPALSEMPLTSSSHDTALHETYARTRLLKKMKLFLLSAAGVDNSTCRAGHM